MTEPKPCTVKGCEATTYHHHDVCNSAEITDCNGPGHCFAFGDWFTPMAAAPKPRPSRKVLAARLAAVEAENADLHAEIADKADRLARLEKVQVGPLEESLRGRLMNALKTGSASEVGTVSDALAKLLAVGAL